MTSPLSSKWRIEKSPFLESTRWVLETEPRIVKWAPAVGCILLLVSFFCAFEIKIDTPEVYGFTVGQWWGELKGEHLLVNVSQKSGLTSESEGSKVVLRLSATLESNFKKVRGTIQTVTSPPKSEIAEVVILLDGGGGLLENPMGTMHVLGNQERLITVLFNRYLKRQRN